MKKYIVSFAIPFIIFAAVAVLAQPTTTQAASIRELINLLIGRGVISSDKVEQATKIATELDTVPPQSGESGPCYVFSTNLVVGSEGPDVVALQTFLISNGYNIPAISSGRQAKGYFGGQTKMAFMNYQAANNLISTGFVDVLTRTSLNRASCGLEYTNQSGITILAPKGDVQVGFQYKLIWKDTRLTLGKGVSPIYVIGIAGSNGKDMISESVPASTYCQSDTCYSGWIPTTVSTNNQITIYDVANDPNGNIVGRSYYFNIVASTTTTKPSITVTSPNGGESLSEGQNYRISWESMNLSGLNISLDLVDYSGRVIRNIANNITNTGSYNWSVPQDLVSETAGTFKILVSSFDKGPSAQDYSDSYFRISSSGGTPPSSGASVTASLVFAGEDKVGLWNNFGPGVGNGNRNPNDWNWSAVLNLSSEKTISRISIIHPTAGEAWSTGYSRYTNDGTDLLGRVEHPYPLVVRLPDGDKDITAYDQLAVRYPAGRYEIKLYGQPETTRFYGGKIIVEFSDGTSATGVIPASSVTQSGSTIVTPPTITTPSITVTSPNGGERYTAGQQIRINWSSNNIPSSNYMSVTVRGFGSFTNIGEDGLQHQVSYKDFSVGGDVLNTGSTVITLPVTIPAEASYTLQIKTVVNGTILDDWSNRYFTITSSQTVINPTVTVLSPNGGEVWQTGNTQTIRWSSGGFDGNVFVSIYNTNGVACNIGTVPASTGQYSFVLSSKVNTCTIIPGQYKIVINRQSNTGFDFGVEDFSNSYFTISSPQTTPSPTPTPTPSVQTITILKPNGGESVVSGQTMNIAWSASLPSATTIDNISLSLISSSGATYPLTVEKSSMFTSGFNGNYSNEGRTTILAMTIPSSIPAGQYRLSVKCNSYCGTNDISDSYFNVLAPAAKPTLQVSTSINGQTFSVGQNINVTWTSANLSATEPITISFSNADNQTIAYNISTTNSGFYNWTIPSGVVPGKYRVQVSCKNCYSTTGSAVYSWGDTFTITAASGQTSNAWEAFMKMFR